MGPFDEAIDDQRGGDRHARAQDQIEAERQRAAMQGQADVADRRDGERVRERMIRRSRNVRAAPGRPNNSAVV
jgi:hypothetical protein